MFSDRSTFFLVILAMNPLAAVAGLVVLFGVIVQVSLQLLFCLLVVNELPSSTASTELRRDMSGSTLEAGPCYRPCQPRAFI